MGQGVNARLQSSVDDLPSAPGDVRRDLADGISGPSLGANAVRTVPHIRFQTGLDPQLHRGLDDAVATRRTAEPAILAPPARRREIDPSARQRPIPLLSELTGTRLQPAVPPRGLDGGDRLLSHARAAAGPTHPPPGRLQHLASLDLVIQQAEPPLRRLRGRAIPRSLEDPHLVC